MFIDQLKDERGGFAEERQEYVKQLMNFNHRVGQLETKLHQLEAPKPHDRPAESGAGENSVPETEARAA